MYYYPIFDCEYYFGEANTDFNPKDLIPDVLDLFAWDEPGLLNKYEF
jgi:hypothetical protein